MAQAIESITSPRFAIQRLVEGEWRTLTFNEGCIPNEDDPYDGRPMIYHSEYVAEHIAKYYDGMVRVHDIGTVVFLEAAE
jgi:hypothetical protein